MEYLPVLLPVISVFLLEVLVLVVLLGDGERVGLDGLLLGGGRGIGGRVSMGSTFIGRPTTGGGIWLGKWAWLDGGAWLWVWLGGGRGGGEERGIE